MAKSGNEEIKELKAVIIGESFTKHLFPLNESTSELFIPVCSVPYIEYLIDMLITAGVTQMIFVVKKYYSNLVDYVKTYLKDLTKKNSRLIHLLLVEDANSIGDCLREVYKENLIQSDFILIRGLTITNFCLEKAFKFHMEIKKADKNAAMTSLFKSLKNEYGVKTVYDDNIIVIDKNTKQLLQYESIDGLDRVKLNSNIKFDLRPGKSREFEVKTNYLDTFIDICSPEVLNHFTDNFDYKNIRDDLLRNYLVSEMYLDTFYLYEIDSSLYCNTIKNMESYLKISNEILNRWAYPISLENLSASKKLNIDYVYSHNNVYLGAGKDSNYNVSHINLARLNSLSDFRNSSLSSLDNAANTVQVSVDCTANIKSSCLGIKTTLKEQVTVFNSVIGKNCFIGVGAKIINSVLHDEVDVGAGVEIIDSVICNNTRISSEITGVYNSYLGSSLEINDLNEKLQNIDRLKISNVRINKEHDSSFIPTKILTTTINEKENTILDDDDDEENEGNDEIQPYNIVTHDQFFESLDQNDLQMIPITGKSEDEQEEDKPDEFTESEPEMNEGDEDFEEPIIKIFERKADIKAATEELAILRRAYWDNTHGESK